MNDCVERLGVCGGDASCLSVGVRGSLREHQVYFLGRKAGTARGRLLYNDTPDTRMD